MAEKCFICRKEIEKERTEKYGKVFCSGQCLGDYEKAIKMTSKTDKKTCEFC